MVASTERRVLAPHVHLQMLKEVVILSRSEGQQHSERAAEGRVQKGLRTSRDQRGSLQRRDSLAHVEIHHYVTFL